MWVLAVDAQNRVRLPLAEIRSIVPWTNVESERIECAATPGPTGGVQLMPVATYQQDVASFTAAIGMMPPVESDSSQGWVEVARLFATVWPIAIHVEPNQMRFTVPEQIRRAKQLPPSGGTVVVFAFGNILEIWDAIKWHDHVRETAKRKAAAISEAIEDLGQR